MSLYPYKIVALRRIDVDNENILPYASFSVRYENMLVAPVYSNSAGSPFPEPLQCDANGEANIWLEDGQYKISVGGSDYFDAYIGVDETLLDLKEDKSSKRNDLLSPNASDYPSTLAVSNAIAAMSAGETPKGAWDADTNTPTLTSSVGTEGDYYYVSVAGSTDLNGEDGWQIGDKAIFASGVWTRVPANSVRSVDGRTGEVILNPDTVAALAALSLPVGSKVSTKGCLSIGDGGQGNFIVEAASGTPDGFSRVLLNNGNHAVLQPVAGFYNILCFGAVADGTTGCVAAIQRALDKLDELKNIYFPQGTYRIESSTSRNTGVTTFFSGHSSFWINGIHDWTMKGDGKFKSVLYFDHASSISARMFDIALCDRFNVIGLGFVGSEVPVNDPPSGSDGYLDRSLAVVKTDGSRFQDLYVKNISRYGMSFERGPYTNNIWYDILFDTTGNDCIDMKSYDLAGVYEQDINYNNHFENITAITWGNLQYEQPNVLLDMRTSNSTAKNIVGLSMQNNGILVRNVSGNGCTIEDAVCYGTSTVPADNQIAFVVAAPDTKIVRPKIFGSYRGVISAFNTEDGRQPYFECINPLIDGCYIGVDTTDYTDSKVFGGAIKNCVFRGIRVGYETLVDGVTFHNNTIPIRLELSASGSVISNCRDTSGGTIASASAGVSALNTIINCDDMATDYSVKFVGRNMVSNGATYTFRPTVFSAPIGAIPNYADDAAAAAGGVAVGQFYRTASAVKIRVS